MAIFRFAGFGEVTVRKGSSILDGAIKGRFPVGSACGGVCACSTCHVYVTGGDNLLDAEETDESDALDKAFDVRSGSRLGCRARVIAEGTVDVEIARESLEAYENEHPQDRGKYTKNGKHGT